MPPTSSPVSFARLLYGLAVAALACVLDQVSKAWLLARLGPAPAANIEVTDFFNLVMVWNPGISFGLFSSQNQPLVFVCLSLAICAALLVWLARARDLLSALALGLTLGGALGNVIDRVRFGAVADFFDVHLAGYHWPAFNIADSCIVIGVVVLCLGGMLADRQRGR